MSLFCVPDHLSDIFFFRNWSGESSSDCVSLLQTACVFTEESQHQSQWKH